MNWRNCLSRELCRCSRILFQSSAHPRRRFATPPIEALESRCYLSAVLIDDSQPGGGMDHKGLQRAPFRIGNELLYQAYKFGPDYYGPQLRASNGSAGSAHWVTSGYGSPSISGSIVEHQGAAYFAGDGNISKDTPVNGLWRYSGGGVSFVADVNPNYLVGLEIGEIVSTGNTLFFVADNGVTGNELWKLGAGGAELVKDIHPGSIGGGISHLTAFGNTLYFLANDGIHGEQVWKSDGTGAGTVPEDPTVRNVAVLQLNHDQLGSLGNISELVAVGNEVVGLASFSPNQASVLFRSDGTANGTFTLVTIPAGEFPNGLIEFRGNVYFGTQHALWKSGGTPASTQIVKSLTGGASNIVLTDNRIAFTSDNTVWFSDGTESGTLPAHDKSQNLISVRVTASLGELAFGSGFDGDYPVNGVGGHGNELWSFSAPAGVGLIPDPGPNSQPFMFDTAFTIDENLLAGKPVGVMSAGELNSEQTLTYSILGGNVGNAFQIDPLTGAIAVQNGAALDFEQQKAFTLHILVFDDGQWAQFDTAIATINLNDLDDVNLPPVFFSLPVFILDENTPTNTLVGTIHASDPNPTQTVSYFMGSGIQNAFEIDEHSGEIRVANATALDFEKVREFQISVIARDSFNPPRDTFATLIIKLNDLNEPPEVTPLTQTIKTSTNLDNFSAFLSGNVTDLDEGQTITYSIVAGNPQNAFGITLGSVLKVVNSKPLTANTTKTYSLTIRATDNGKPSLSSEGVVTVVVESHTKSGKPVNLSPTVNLPTVQEPVFVRSTNQPVVLDSAANIDDPDTPNPNYGKAKLVAKIAKGGDKKDVLTVLNEGSQTGQLQVNGKDTSLNGKQVATFKYSSASKSLTVTFATGAGDDSVDAVLRNLAFTTTSAATANNDRELSLQLTATGGVKSNVAKKILHLRNTP